MMPDSHLGMENGAPIGSVIACRDVLVPNFVGVDANCGVGAMRTSLNLADFGMKRDNLVATEMGKTVHHAVSRTIPVGFSHNTDERRKRIEEAYAAEISHLMECYSENAEILKDKKEIASQLGTLGGG